MGVRQIARGEFSARHIELIVRQPLNHPPVEVAFAHLGYHPADPRLARGEVVVYRLHVVEVVPLAELGVLLHHPAVILHPLGKELPLPHIQLHVASVELLILVLQLAIAIERHQPPAHIVVHRIAGLGVYWGIERSCFTLGAIWPHPHRLYRPIIRQPAQAISLRVRSARGVLCRRVHTTSHRTAPPYSPDHRGYA